MDLSTGRGDQKESSIRPKEQTNATVFVSTVSLIGGKILKRRCEISIVTNFYGL